MNLFLKKILLVCFCFFLYSYANAQVKFYTDVSLTSIGENDFINYRIVFENVTNIKRITAPSFKNFRIINGPVQVIGKGKQSVALVYILQPLKTGKLKIDPASTIVDGKNLKSNEIIVTVKNEPLATNNQPNPFPVYDPFDQRPASNNANDHIFKEGDNVEEKVGKNMQLKLEVNKTSCYVGQPIIAAYKLYTRLESETKLPQNLSFNGFSVIDIKQPGFDNISKETVNGKEYHVFTIRKAQLYALQPGLINLEAATLENDVKFVKEAYARQLPGSTDIVTGLANSLFPPEATIVKLVTLRSLPIDITVKPLPANKPASFNGAVGYFEINASLQRPLFSTDEAGKLTVTITGSGNMQLLTAPAVHWPNGIESFEPKFYDKLEKTTVPVSGEKKFEYSFAANDSGHYILPAINFSYFDPATEAYKEIATDPIQFQVTKGNGQPIAISMLKKLQEKPSFINRIFYHRWWIIIFIGIVIFAGLIIWLLTDKQRPAGKATAPVAKEDNTAIDEMIEAAALNQKNVFPEAEKCLYKDDCFGFYSLLNTELKNYLAAKFSIDANGINSNSIIGVMDRRGIPNDIVLKLQAIMQDIEWQLYTPFERNEKMNSLYQEAHEIVQMINAQAARY